MGGLSVYYIELHFIQIGPFVLWAWKALKPETASFFQAEHFRTKFLRLSRSKKFSGKTFLFDRGEIQPGSKFSWARKVFETVPKIFPTLFLGWWAQRGETNFGGNFSNLVPERARFSSCYLNCRDKFSVFEFICFAAWSQKSKFL